MADTFTKLFSSITASSVWDEDSDTRVVWITMLAMADKDGYVGASVPGLAAMARVSKELVVKALAKFMSPDPYSRTRDYDGRRIEEAERGWNLLNHASFRARRDAEIRKVQNAKAQAKARAKKSASVLTRADESAKSAQADTDTDTDTDGEECVNTRALAAAKPANDRTVPASQPPKGSQVATSARIQEFHDTLASELFELGVSPAPRIAPNQLAKAAERAAELAKASGCTFEVATRKLTKAAHAEHKSSGKAYAFALVDCTVTIPKAVVHGYYPGAIDPERPWK